MNPLKQLSKLRIFNRSNNGGETHEVEWHRLTVRARRVIHSAEEEARRLGNNDLSTEHFLLGLAREENSAAALILGRLGISPDRIRSEVERQVKHGGGQLGARMKCSASAKRAIDLAWDEAQQIGNKYIGTEYLLLGLIREENGLAGRVLADLGIELQQTRQEVTAFADSFSAREAACADQFADAFTKLPAADQAAIAGSGVPLCRLPESMQQAVRELAEVHRPNGALQFDPDEIVHVSVGEGEGATSYTVTTRVNLLVSLRVTDARFRGRRSGADP
jgi:ATP-dependent Clp protease ATP-binding subunit ClpA